VTRARCTLQWLAASVVLLLAWSMPAAAPAAPGPLPTAAASAAGKTATAHELPVAFQIDRPDLVDTEWRCGGSPAAWLPARIAVDAIFPFHPRVLTIARAVATPNPRSFDPRGPPRLA
jgi:hypothetical protein